MIVLIGMVFSTLVTSIYAELNIIDQNLKTISRGKGTEYHMVLNEGMLDSNISMKLTADMKSVNESQTIMVTGGTDSTTIKATTATDSNWTIITTKSSTSLSTRSMGEPPPTRSAQLGMGIGIPFIALFIIAEIIYFKYFYHGALRTDNYLA